MVVTTAGTNLGAVALTSLGGVALARSLGAADRGQLVVVLLWPAAAGSLASLGITQATCYWISRRPRSGVAIRATATRAAILTGLAVAVVGLVLAPLIGRSDLVTSLLRAVFVLSPLFIAGGVWMSSLQAVDIAVWNRCRMVQPIAYSATTIGLALLEQLTLTAATVAFSASLIAQTAYSRLRSGRSVVGAEPASEGFLAELYRYGVGVWVSTVPRLLNVRLDQLVLSVAPAVTSSELGVYAVAASLSWLALPIATAFGSVAFPAVAGATEDATRARIERVSLQGAAVSAAVVLTGVSVAAPLAVPWVFGREFEDAVVALWLLAPGTVFLAMNRVLADVLQGRGRPLSTSVGEGTAAVVTVALLLILTPTFGIRGAAAASSFAYAAATAVMYLRLRVVRRSSMPQSTGSPPS